MIGFRALAGFRGRSAMPGARQPRIPSGIDRAMVEQHAVPRAATAAAVLPGPLRGP